MSQYLDLNGVRFLWAKVKELVAASSSTSTVSVADSADRLTFARNISLSGDVSGDADFDGTDDITIDSSVSAISNTELEALFK